MKIALFSDIHANQQALDAVWKDIKTIHPEEIYCLGDLVGYGPHPNEVVQFVRTNNVPTLMGNYDKGVGFDLGDCGCVYQHPADIALGNLSLKWAREHTSPQNKTFLRNLPMTIEAKHAGKRLLFVHGSPRAINEYMFADRPEATFARIAKAANCDLLLFGHTHMHYKKQVGGTLFVNTGSVGKPKDGDPRAGYVMLTLGTGTIDGEFRRVDYDVAKTAHAVRASGLPHDFAIGLETGGVPHLPA